MAFLMRTNDQSPDSLLETASRRGVGARGPAGPALAPAPAHGGGTDPNGRWHPSREGFLTMCWRQLILEVKINGQHTFQNRGLESRNNFHHGLKEMVKKTEWQWLPMVAISIRIVTQMLQNLQTDENGMIKPGFMMESYQKYFNIHTSTQNQHIYIYIIYIYIYISHLKW